MIWNMKELDEILELKRNKFVVDELKCMVTTFEIYNDKYNIHYVDYVQLEDDRPDKFVCSVYSKDGLLNKKINEYDLKQELVDKISFLSNKHFNSLSNDIRKKSIYKETHDVLGDEINIINRINQLSNYLSSQNHVGSANCIIISQKYLDKYKNIVSFQSRYKFIIAEIDDILIYRISDNKQTGILLVHTNKKYEFVECGKNIERNYIKLKII